MTAPYPGSSQDEPTLKSLQAEVAVLRQELARERAERQALPTLLVPAAAAMERKIGGLEKDSRELDGPGRVQPRRR
jgi:hypothetical protein